MFNYAEIDKHITLKDLALAMQWFDEVDKATAGSLMVTSIDRKGCHYDFHLSAAGYGYTHSFKIEDGVVTSLGKNGVWMS